MTYKHFSLLNLGLNNKISTQLNTPMGIEDTKLFLKSGIQLCLRGCLS